MRWWKNDNLEKKHGEDTGVKAITRVQKILIVSLMLILTTTMGKAQNVVVSDSIIAAVDSMFAVMPADTAILQTPDSLTTPKDITSSKPARIVRQQVDWATWKPNPQKALWLALVIPGGGQIYNRKYWKLPLVYGGFVGCAYAMSWNNMMYKDYAQAYLDIMDDDPGTASYNKFLHLGRQITTQNEERYKTIFKKRKDRYRRYRDMSFFCMIGVYALSVIDAYVDAELSEFDISKDLSLRVEPTLIRNSSSGAGPTSSGSATLGLYCSLSF